MAGKGEDKLSRLLEAANGDRHLKLMLLADPRKVAKEWGVELGDREAERLQKLGAFVELATEVSQGSVFACDPRVCYPVFTWLRFETIRLVRSLIRYHVFYPAPQFDRVEHRIDRNLGLLAKRGM